MTLLISVVGLVARFAAALLTTALGWASTLLFGRVQRRHQVFVALMLAGALLWLVLVASAIAPVIPNFLLGITPHPGFIGPTLISATVLVGIAIVPAAVGIAAWLVPASGERETRVALVREILRGYLLTPILGALMLFLPAVGISRKLRSVRHGWSDSHIPIVAKPDGYDRIVGDLQAALAAAGTPVVAEDAPAVLSMPAWILTRVAGGNVRRLRPDRLVELIGPRLRIGVYPSDVAISGPSPERERARAAILSRLTTTAAHLTTSAEAQAFEDRLTDLAARHRARGVPGRPGAASDPDAVRAEFDALDTLLLDLPVGTDEWDILYRMRLQVERDILAGATPGTEFPTGATPATESSTGAAGHDTGPGRSGRRAAQAGQAPVTAASEA
jgi:hypothetical protein